MNELEGRRRQDPTRFTFDQLIDWRLWPDPKPLRARRHTRRAAR